MSPAVALLGVRVLLALCLYAFLAWALLLMWRDLRRAGTGAAGAIPGAHLAWLETAGATPPIPVAETNLIGRASDNTIRIEDATVSAHHARLAFLAGQWILEDLGSRNGTRVNGIAVEGPMVVTYGDDVQLGEVVLGLRAGGLPRGDSSPAQPPDGRAS